MMIELLMVSGTTITRRFHLDVGALGGELQLLLEQRCPLLIQVFRAASATSVAGALASQ